MFKNILYPRTLVLLIILAALAAWQVYSGWAPLLAWIVLIMAQMAITAIMVFSARATLHKHTQPESLQSAQMVGNLTQAIEQANSQSDTKGQPTPRLPAGIFNTVGAGVASQVRAYASVEDAQSYGWDFSEEIGTFNDTPIFGIALLDEKRWEYEGLVSDKMSLAIPSDRRVFGRLRYREAINDLSNSPASAAPKSEVKGVVSSESSASPKVESDVRGLSVT